MSLIQIYQLSQVLRLKIQYCFAHTFSFLPFFPVPIIVILGLRGGKQEIKLEYGLSIPSLVFQPQFHSRYYLLSTYFELGIVQTMSYLTHAAVPYGSNSIVLVFLMRTLSQQRLQIWILISTHFYLIPKCSLSLDMECTQ